MKLDDLIKEVERYETMEELGMYVDKEALEEAKKLVRIGKALKKENAELRKEKEELRKQLGE